MLLESWQNPVVEVVVKNLGKKLKETVDCRLQSVDSEFKGRDCVSLVFVSPELSKVPGT